MKSISFLARWVLAAGLLAGCGGGSSGTGVQGARFEGTVADAAGNPVPGASVTVEETGDTDVTDANGHFTVDVDGSQPSNTLIITSPAAAIEVTIQTGEAAGAPQANGGDLASGPYQVSGSVVP